MASHDSRHTCARSVLPLELGGSADVTFDVDEWAAREEREGSPLVVSATQSDGAAAEPLSGSAQAARSKPLVSSSPARRDVPTANASRPSYRPVQCLSSQPSKLLLALLRLLLTLVIAIVTLILTATVSHGYVVAILACGAAAAQTGWQALDVAIGGS